MNLDVRSGIYDFDVWAPISGINTDFDAWTLIFDIEADAATKIAWVLSSKGIRVTSIFDFLIFLLFSGRGFNLKTITQAKDSNIVQNVVSLDLDCLYWLVEADLCLVVLVL